MLGTATNPNAAGRYQNGKSVTSLGDCAKRPPLVRPIVLPSFCSTLRGEPGNEKRTTLTPAAAISATTMIAVGFHRLSRWATVSEIVTKPGGLIADQISGIAITTPAHAQTP